MMPLCTTEMPPLTCGCALVSVGRPWVAQRVWAMPMVPCTCCSSTSRPNWDTRPVERTRCSFPFTTARPAESYPRYSRRRRPSIRIGTTLRRAMAPTIPHMCSASLFRVGVGALVGVVDPDDVVLTEVGPGLHLDQLERHLAGVLQAVLLAELDVDGLVLGEQDHLVAAGHARRAAHDDPVLGAVVVELERQLLARIDGDALHAETVARVDVLVATPRAVHEPMGLVLGAGRDLQLLDRLAHALRLA